MNIVERDDCAASVGLTDRDLQNESRDGQEEDGDEVWNEPL